MSNIEEYKTKNFIKAYEEAKAQSFIIESINKDFFFEFADCLIARIKELEEENRIYALNGNNIELEIYIKDNYIPKQKIKDVIKNIKEKIEKSKKRKKDKWVVNYIGAEYLLDKIEKILLEDK